LPVTPQAHIRWQDGLLSEGVQRLEAHFRGSTRPRAPSLDVVVPTYRCDLDVLRAICRLRVANQATTFILIVDNPPRAEAVMQLEALPRVRVRVNLVRISSYRPRVPH
jgi:hypothetical protein